MAASSSNPHFTDHAFAITQFLGITPTIREDAPPISHTCIRDRLMTSGVLPSPEAAKTAFWALGADWWKQIIDGCYHSYGSHVFDLGLHGRCSEPGYLDGIEKASHIFLDGMNEGLTIDLYRKIHSAACSHFQKKPGDGTLCAGYEVDLFRTTSGHCTVPTHHLSDCCELADQLSQEALAELSQEHAQLEALALKLWINPHASADTIHSAQAMLGKYCEDKICTETDRELLIMMIENIQKEITRKINNTAHSHSEKIKNDLCFLSNTLGLSPYFTSSCVNKDGSLNINYAEARLMITENKTNSIISLFNEMLRGLQKAAYQQLEFNDVEIIKNNYQDAALSLIQWLYSSLEWLHPWIDGQGRTDLITLNGLLCREGIHPCILEYPYFSTSHSIQESLGYLRRGLTAYQRLRAQVEFKPPERPEGLE